MDQLFAWQNVIFYIPLIVGLLLVFGAAFGGHGHDAGGHDAGGHDAGGHDAGGDHGHAGGALDAAHALEHEPGVLARSASLLGVGRVPLTVVLMMASLLFGGIGIIANTILGSLGLAVWLFAPLSIALALVGMVTLTGATARLLDRVMPTTETYRVSRHDFAGCTGTLLLPADGQMGLAQVKDREGNVHNIKCRTIRGLALPKGAEILVVEYDEETKTFVIDASPAAPTQA